MVSLPRDKSEKIPTASLPALGRRCNDRAGSPRGELSPDPPALPRSYKGGLAVLPRKSGGLSWKGWKGRRRRSINTSCLPEQGLEKLCFLISQSPRLATFRPEARSSKEMWTAVEVKRGGLSCVSWRGARGLPFHRMTSFLCSTRRQLMSDSWLTVDAKLVAYPFTTRCQPRDLTFCHLTSTPLFNRTSLTKKWELHLTSSRLKLWSTWRKLCRMIKGEKFSSRIYFTFWMLNKMSVYDYDNYILVYY